MPARTLENSLGSRGLQRALRVSFESLRTLRRWAGDDEEFREAVGHAWEIARARLARSVRKRVLEVALHGAPEVLIYEGRIQYESDRD